MRVVWDEPKRAANIANHGTDFIVLEEAFFSTSVVGPAKRGRLIAVGRSALGVITVIFTPLGTEGVSVISIRPASRKERKRVNG